MPGLLSFVFVFVSPPNLCVKELSVRIVKEFREHLVNELSQKAATVAQSQAEKRLELNGRMKAMVCERVDDISRKVPCLLHSATSFCVDRDDDGIIQHSCWKDITRHFLISGTRGCGHNVVVFHWMTTVCRIPTMYAFSCTRPESVPCYQPYGAPLDAPDPTLDAGRESRRSKRYYRWW